MVATSFFLRILSHSPLAAISCNISFLLACISLKFSFLHGSYFICPANFVSFPPGSYFMQYFIPSGRYFIEIFISSWQLLHSSFRFCLIPPWQLFHAIFHSFWHVFQSNFHFFMAATSFSLGFCLIPPWQLFHAIFHSSWHVFH